MGPDLRGPAPDLAQPAPDLATSIDLASAGDLVAPADLAAASDLAAAADLAVPSDLTVAPDLVAPPDLTPPADLTPPPDLAPPADLTPPPDLVTPPDLTPTCGDGQKNGSETDVDCGGPNACSRCGAGKGCQGGGDCATGYCANNKCAVPDCKDGVKNGGETDLDCGGTCPPCGDGKACKVGADCASAVCATNQCAKPACNDGQRNGGESDVDCGGACPACAPGKKCGGNADCAPNLCAAGLCKVAVSCAEHLAAGSKVSGLYTIQPANAMAPIKAYCEMVLAGGGWTLVFHAFDVTGLSENKFIAAAKTNRFTDVSWDFAGGAFTVGANAKPPQPLVVNGALDVGLFGGGWKDLRMACSKKNKDATEAAFGLIRGFATTNGNGKLLGAAPNGKSYVVDKTENSQGNSTIWVDNELDGINSGHYLCDYTSGSAANGTTQLSLCYTDFLNNDNSKDMGDSIVAIAFGTERGDDGWSPGFTFECGPMGDTALQNTGTFSVWIR